ncbi:hypothetical protein BDZ85DRAFT_268273 [Elsinoe ampelina]|uniref:Uncharacterized protein n=1 Tax=Elsinoe ampelina TaxID=302913 RepID=A0A6A6G2J1_9PEZI|nr:hypothetical protein BDZ85DRAFT_268273 [Elsinoe ampelina]
MRPTCNDVALLLQWMKAYAEGVTINREAGGAVGGAQSIERGHICVQIDKAIPSAYDTNNSARPVKSTRKYIRNQNDIDNVRKFIEANTARLEGTMHARRLVGTDECDFDIFEAGYTDNASRRKTEHARHASSNRLLYLVDAIFRTLLASSGVSMIYRTIMVLDSPDQAGLAEHLVTKLGGGYVEDGGCNGTYAGHSVGKSRTIDPLIYELQRLENVQRGVVTHMAQVFLEEANQKLGGYSEETTSISKTLAYANAKITREALRAHDVLTEANQLREFNRARMLKLAPDALKAMRLYTVVDDHLEDMIDDFSRYSALDRVSVLSLQQAIDQASMSHLNPFKRPPPEQDLTQEASSTTQVTKSSSAYLPSSQRKGQ